jgi:hypothetical protein
MRSSLSSRPTRDCKNEWRLASKMFSEPWTKSRTPWLCISRDFFSLDGDEFEEVARRMRTTAEMRMKSRVKLRRRRPSAMSPSRKKVCVLCCPSFVYLSSVCLKVAERVSGLGERVSFANTYRTSALQQVNFPARAPRDQVHHYVGVSSTLKT